MVAKPAEQVLGQIAGIEHTYSVARPGMALLTVQFKVGVPRTEALVRLYDVLNANQDWLPRDLGTLTPIVKPKGIDDVPVLAVTLWSKDAAAAVDLETVAHAWNPRSRPCPVCARCRPLAAPAGHSDRLDPERLRERGIDTVDLQRTAGRGQFWHAGRRGAAKRGLGAQMLNVEPVSFCATPTMWPIWWLV
jgi:hypothetical protein